MTDQANPLHDRIRASVPDINKPFGLMTRLTFVDEHAADMLAQIVADVIPPSRAEPGCLTYQVSRDCDDPLVFILYDRWANLKAVEDHEASAHFLAGVARMEGLVAGKTTVSLLSPMGELSAASWTG